MNAFLHMTSNTFFMSRIYKKGTSRKDVFLNVYDDLRKFSVEKVHVGKSLFILSVPIRNLHLALKELFKGKSATFIRSDYFYVHNNYKFSNSSILCSLLETISSRKEHRFNPLKMELSTIYEISIPSTKEYPLSEKLLRRILDNINFAANFKRGENKVVFSVKGYNFVYIMKMILEVLSCKIYESIVIESPFNTVAN